MTIYSVFQKNRPVFRSENMENVKKYISEHFKDLMETGYAIVEDVVSCTLLRNILIDEKPTGKEIENDPNAEKAQKFVKVLIEIIGGDDNE